jgi:hypothetical protein
MTFSANEVLTAANLNALDINTLNTSSTVTIGGALTLNGSSTYVAPADCFGSGVTVGNGTGAGYYVDLGDLAQWQGYFQLGSTSAITGTVNLALPVTKKAGSITGISGGTVHLRDASVGVYYKGRLSPVGTTQSRVQVDSVYLNPQSYGVDINATTPFTWTTSDRIIWNFVYASV